MYNSITEEKIKQIPAIGNIDIDRLPQELTRIYAQIISLRRQLAESPINIKEEGLIDSLKLIQTLANNLETLLIVNPKHEKKESVAFVAATAHSLIQKISFTIQNDMSSILDIDTISPIISGIILYLIGNSQADAAEMAQKTLNIEGISKTKRGLISYIKALAQGRLLDIIENPLNEEDIIALDSTEISLEYLWREVGLGIYSLASRLIGAINNDNLSNHFDRVIELSVADEKFESQKSVFTGPYHLAKLLKILEDDILTRGVINIPTPQGVGKILWEGFLADLAKERPYLWENHIDAVATNFLEPGISAVMTLPTGAGKSTLTELKIASCLYSSGKVIYLVPTHALEDQVTKNLKSLFTDFNPELIDFGGEFTEFGMNDSFPILVMTPERCLTLLNMDLLRGVELVVFDEFHLINGSDIKKDRRAIDAMYCLISLFTNIPKADFLLTSAMVENGNEIAEWIKSITGRDCKLFTSSWKPTRQLHGCLVFEEDKVKELNKIVKDSRVFRQNPPKKLKDLMKITPNCFFSLKNIWETKNDNDYYNVQILADPILLGINNFWNLIPNRNDIASRLGIHFTKLGFKTLIFVDNPKITNSTAKKIRDGIGKRTNCYSEYIQSKSLEVDGLKLELGSFDHSYLNDHDNVGEHHGLLLQTERNLIEEYFKKADGSIALIATTTLAQGINLPAEIVIIAGDDRFDVDSEEVQRVAPHELLNAAGRAGRAGQSSQGAVILIPGKIVTIKNSAISNRWWQLKDEIFSKSDQCLRIEDPLEYFLDSIQDESESLDINQTNILYKFKAEKLSGTETKAMFDNSFYAFKAAKADNMETFNAQVACLIKRRNKLDNLSEDDNWIREISFKTGIDPNLILKLGKEIDKEDFQSFINLSVNELIVWFFDWLQKSIQNLYGIYTKQSTIDQIKKATGISPKVLSLTEEHLEKIHILKNLLIQYVSGDNLEKINKSIAEKEDTYLTKARNFAIRLIPELSFSFGILSLIIIEKALQKGYIKEETPWSIRALASCIREGVDSSEKLFYKTNNKIRGRVEAHVRFEEAKTK